ncbi:MAG TPA: erythromycin esterase family protein [Gemmataceae bacterium]|nr:erythromycin esterase family protein [Gemmataceae bacterium]
MMPTRGAPDSVNAWIARESIPFSLDPGRLGSAFDRLLEELGAVDLLGIGEPLHGGEEFLVVRNRLFEHLVAAHGYSAIAVESSFPRGRFVDEYIAGRGTASFEAVADGGFSHGFGKLAANRELVEWIRTYNAEPTHAVKLRFYGFDGPLEMTGTDGPRQLVRFALDYLAEIDGPTGRERLERIEPLLGPDAEWENPAAMMDPSKSIGLSPTATSLRIEVEDLLTELAIRRPEFVAKTDRNRYLEAVQHGTGARQLLNYHAGLARKSTRRIAELLGIRDAMMADNLVTILERERGRGKVLAYATTPISSAARQPGSWGLKCSSGGQPDRRSRKCSAHAMPSSGERSAYRTGTALVRPKPALSKRD